MTCELWVYRSVAVLCGVVMLYSLSRWTRQRGRKNAAKVELRCPQTGETFATELTLPDERDGDNAAYNCSACPHTHIFQWGPPAPIYRGDRDPPIRYPGGRRLAEVEG